MLGQLRPAIVMMVCLTLLTGLAYPLAMTGIAQLVFPAEANGSLVEKDGKVIGSSLIGQNFTDDRYFHGRGTFSGTGRGYQLTLVEEQALEDVDLPWVEARRNVVTRGIALNTLVGRRFTVGTAECIGRRLAEPCSHLERLTWPGIIRPLVHRAGLRADILRDGRITLGDGVVPH